MVMVSAGDLMSLYMGLELQSLALYVVAAIRRDMRAVDRGRAEILRPRRAVLGAAALRRLADLWLCRHHAVLRASSTRPAPTSSIGLLFGLVFLITGLAFKVSAVPFHMWTPDVYEGAPTPVTAFFATAPKVAAMALFARRDVRRLRRRQPRLDARSWRCSRWPRCSLARIAAIGQRNIKRLMAYSSIAHMGFALMGLAAGTAGGRAGDADLHGDLRHDERRHLRLHPVDEPRRHSR